MKILHFFASKVHGTYNFDFDFHRDVTFLVGINGSGKTTALRLIQGALSLDLSILYSIKFSELSLTIERDGTRQTITMKNQGNALQVTFGNDEPKVKLPFLSDEERSTYAKNGRLDEHLDELRLASIRNIPESGRRLLSAEKPLFLGLERRTGRYDDELSLLEDERKMNVYRAAYRREMRDGLDACQSLIERAYRQFRRVSDTSNSRLISVVIGSTFDYIKFEPESLAANQKSSYLELQELLVRRKELEAFALDLGGGNTLAAQIDQFFQQITAMFTLNEKTETGFSIELLMNKVQIQRFHKILAELDKQKKHAEKAYAPISGFVNAMNRFFDQSRKQVEVDSIGRLKITQAGQTIPAQSLSSGEKQLLILMAHAILSANKGGVFIVDEPELSLHLRWQEMLVSELMNANKNNQFIFATHSPEIVGYLKDNCVDVE